MCTGYLAARDVVCVIVIIQTDLLKSNIIILALFFVLDKLFPGKVKLCVDREQTFVKSELLGPTSFACAVNEF